MYISSERSLVQIERVVEPEQESEYENAEFKATKTFRTYSKDGWKYKRNCARDLRVYSKSMGLRSKVGQLFALVPV